MRARARAGGGVRRGETPMTTSPTHRVVVVDGDRGERSHGLESERQTLDQEGARTRALVRRVRRRPGVELVVVAEARVRLRHDADARRAPQRDELRESVKGEQPTHTTALEMKRDAQKPQSAALSLSLSLSAIRKAGRWERGKASAPVLAVGLPASVDGKPTRGVCRRRQRRRPRRPRRR